MIAALVVLLLLQPADIVTGCTEAEARAYIAQGWDPYECDGDKAARAEEVTQ